MSGEQHPLTAFLYVGTVGDLGASSHENQNRRCSLGFTY